MDLEKDESNDWVREACLRGTAAYHIALIKAGLIESGTMLTLGALIARKHGTTVRRMKSPCRVGEVMKARSEAYFLFKRVLKKSGREIGAFMIRDYSTVNRVVKALACNSREAA